MEKITFTNPGSISYGAGSLKQFFQDYRTKGYNRLFLLTIPVLRPVLEPFLKGLTADGIALEVNDQINQEPSYAEFEGILESARSFGADSVAGIGGGSVLDTAKLLAAMLYNKQPVLSVIGIGKLKERKTYLACLPTTSGTGSEVSPNAIFLDETDQEKKGVISSFLVPDAVYVDPELTVGVPPAVTAFTGIDAFTHCLEAYVNRCAHPVTDRLALEGMRLIFQNLKRVCVEGSDVEARTRVALGSVYGGMCLGPVNTAAVHALAYPLGSRYKVAHGLSNAVLLPYVMEYNLPAAPERFAGVARAVGLAGYASIPDEAAGREAIAAIRRLLDSIGIPGRMRELGIPADALEEMAVSAMKVKRLLKNNVRELGLQDVLEIYRRAF